MNHRIVKCKCGEETIVVIESNPNHFVEIGCIVEGKLPADGTGLIRQDGKIFPMAKNRKKE